MDARNWTVIEYGPPLRSSREFAARREFAGDSLSGLGWIARGMLTTRARAKARAARANRAVYLRDMAAP